jgi:hypothetical protein
MLQQVLICLKNHKLAQEKIMCVAPAFSGLQGLLHLNPGMLGCTA